MSRSESGGSGAPPRWRQSPVERVEAVLRQEAPALARHQVDRVEDEGEDRLADEVVEVDPHPAGLDPLAAAGDLALELVRALEVDAQQPVAVRPGAGAAAAGLDAEQVVEQGDHVVVVEVAAAVADDERDDREARERRVAQDLEGRVRAPALDRPADEVLLALADRRARRRPP